ncbi:hypothetical protein CCM_06333 [Cordyceps militaris CM01]|uniref:Uncharacterized protein n=1 Tax=Cordyceps militaris (strain CM01) TaxID=983644 RepID=G3JK42_CORMM|nr:uncharacterized protein CCM_06333 [Cordyceps militaris CM01]EGX92172.1 hypothetical protein CCM_06333 [Cordyceps militaris CM01]
MSLSRAFTTSRRKLGLDTDSTHGFMKRSNTTKTPDIRLKISGPVELIHTTNILTYSAPDLPRRFRSDSDSTSSKAADSDTETFTTADSTPPTSPDVSPAERDCASPTPEPNHLSCYFQTTGQPITPDPAAPAIPRRSPSHTKKASYEALARKRSVSRQSRDSDMSASSRPGLTFSRSSSTSTRASSGSSTFAQKSGAVTPPVNASKEMHPFGQELAQVSELAEEYGAGDKLAPIDEEEELYLSSRGLAKFNADDYLGLAAVEKDRLDNFIASLAVHIQPHTAGDIWDKGFNNYDKVSD